MKFSILCATVLITYISIKGIGISVFLKKIANANFIPKVSSSYVNKIFSGSFDIFILIPSEKIGHGELMSSWAEGNPGWAYGPPY